MHTFQRSFPIAESIAQFQRLRIGYLLALKTILTAMNVFKFYLEDLSPNGVIAGVRRNLGCDDNLSEIDRLLCKLNEAMDIDVLLSSGCKKHKTFMGAVGVNLSSEEEESST
ncbi:hypothetical protein J1N35_013970 [Gossypium stocksii]|uniref:Uncharacterized protein n=1 Tax=Gossypium stocksii TaxID=47602 RepID=A0A9D3VW42_9ROSI|nr:hypothetical protein J1N35_013970 [Gossypium stocksii]